MYVKLENYTKILKKRAVLDDININFESGKIYGIYGRNGSGKTMLMRAIAGLIYPTSGGVIIDGKVLHKDISFPENMGIIIENIELLPQYDGFTNLKLLAKIRKKATDDDIYKALSDVGLKEAEKKKVKEYSLGMKQKLAIAQAIYEKPSLLLLDEPTNALDIKSVEMVRDLFAKLRDEGALILFSSHNKEDIELLADKVIEMDNGKIINN